MPNQGEKDDDRNRNAKQPQKNATTHVTSPYIGLTIKPAQSRATRDNLAANEDRECPEQGLIVSNRPRSVTKAWQDYCFERVTICVGLTNCSAISSHTSVVIM